MGGDAAGEAVQELSEAYTLPRGQARPAQALAPCQARKAGSSLNLCWI